MTGLLFFNCFSASRIYCGKAKLEECFQEQVAVSAGPHLFSAPREVLQPGPCWAHLLPCASVLSVKVMVSGREMWLQVTTARVWMQERRPGSDLLARGPGTES